ncbi:MAG: YqgE/AlgH family protein [Rhodospirillaceae bacterium]|jgi:putative transcriptional regulator|nr:YqgE/AlgH family protein [Rhodospirillaceae bacterium]MBT6405846.1 YqgE/AlgH family protein [Rhodospirillaceae bacterium]MBT6535036.1 YqgE/AlgH family protein [Rhodospirillaceae bacterium]MBT7363104.1 YqgE/AlgH family protein [Rhodospirillaceae bacterium]
MTDTETKAGTYFEGQMLLAMPAMTDPRFERAVIYMCAHNDEGAMGLVINKTLDSIDFRELLGQLDIPAADSARDVTVHFGGPVENQRGFVLHSGEYRHSETLMVTDQVGLTATLDILRALAQGEGPERSILALGYAGWGAGQLDAEIHDNAWLSVPYDENLMFEVSDDDKWERAFNSIGVDLSVLSGTSGRA